SVVSKVSLASYTPSKLVNVQPTGTPQEAAFSKLPLTTMSVSWLQSGSAQSVRVSQSLSTPSEQSVSTARHPPEAQEVQVPPTQALVGQSVLPSQTFLQVPSSQVWSAVAHLLPGAPQFQGSLSTSMVYSQRPATQAIWVRLQVAPEQPRQASPLLQHGSSGAI